MKGWIPTSLRARLVGLVLAALLPLLALILYSASEQRATAALETERHAEAVARLASASLTRLFEGARQLLSALAQLPEARQLEPGVLDRAFRQLVEQHPFYLNLVLAQPDGVVLSSAVALEQPVNISEFACFQAALRQQTFATGGFRLGKLAGRPSLGVAAPVPAPQGPVRTVLVASLDLQILQRELASIELANGGSLAVVDGQGQVLAVVPQGQEVVGELAQRLPIGQELLRGRDGKRHRGRGRDGVERLYASAPVQVGRGLVDAWVVMAIPMASIYAEANNQRQLQLLGLAFVVAVALGCAWLGLDWLVLRHVRALVGAAQKMKEGELGVRSGLAAANNELGQLAGAFDEMAVALQQRDAERLRAADALRRSRDQLEGLVQARTMELGRERDLLRSLVDALPEFVYVKDTQGRYVVDNTAHRGLLGVQGVEQIIGRTALDFFPAELAERYQADDRQVLASGLPLRERHEQVVDASGCQFWISTTKVPLRDSTGRIIGLVGIGRELPKAQADG